METRIAWGLRDCGRKGERKKDFDDNDDSHFDCMIMEAEENEWQCE